MKNELQQILLRWPKRVIRDVDLAPMLTGTVAARHNMVKRALQEGVLSHLIRGVYLIEEPYAKETLNRFEVAQMLEGTCYVSFESALSYHQLIPEAVYVTSCATSHRTRKLSTSKGDFRFQHIPERNFFLGVERISTDGNVFLMATPWRALADHYFVFKRPWNSLEAILEDLRIDKEDLGQFSKEPLRVLASNYPSPRVRKLLRQLYDQ